MEGFWPPALMTILSSTLRHGIFRNALSPLHRCGRFCGAQCDEEDAFLAPFSCITLAYSCLG
jgi:hypothetical protein